MTGTSSGSRTLVQQPMDHRCPLHRQVAPSLVDGHSQVLEGRSRVRQRSGPRLHQWVLGDHVVQAHSAGMVIKGALGRQHAQVCSAVHTRPRGVGLAVGKCQEARVIRDSRQRVALTEVHRVSLRHAHWKLCVTTSGASYVAASLHCGRKAAPLWYI